MYKNKSETGANNICGSKIRAIRKALPMKTSQRKLVQRIESGARFVTDIELKIIAKVLKVSYDELLK